MDFWTQFRFISFLVGLALFTVLGLIWPRRPLAKHWLHRYGHNLLLGGANPILVRLILGWGLVEWTMWVQRSGYGLLNKVHWNTLLEVAIVVVLLDFIIYWQHVITHHVPVLWRLHRVHHTDTSFDSSTALRFHFVEIAFSYLIKTAAIGILGGPVLGVVLFEVVLNFSAMFNHANWRLPQIIDSLLRKVIVTPDFHRVHHSPIVKETNSNYGFFLSVWDYIFGSYRSQPKGGHQQMTIGLNSFRSEKEQNFAALWLQPLKKDSTLKE